MLSLAFSAGTFRAFWRYWNPAFAYLLQYYCYAPLRRGLSRPVSVVLTFAVSGFLLHDVVVWSVANSLGYRYKFPVVAVAFVLLGSWVLVTDYFRLNLRSLPSPMRAVVHGGTIVCALALAVGAAIFVSVPGA
jgi:hypothetical protein